MMIVMDWIYKYKKSTSEISNILLYLLSTFLPFKDDFQSTTSRWQSEPQVHLSVGVF